MKKIFESTNIIFAEVSNEFINDYIEMLNDYENVGKYFSESHEPYTVEGEMQWVKSELDEKAVVAIERALNKNNRPYQKCKTWTTDGFYRETREMILYRKEEGCSVVEMECASMAACAKMRNVVFGQLLFTADSLADTDCYDGRNWGNEHFAYAMTLAFDAVLEV